MRDSHCCCVGQSDRCAHSSKESRIWIELNVNWAGTALKRLNCRVPRFVVAFSSQLHILRSFVCGWRRRRNNLIVVCTTIWYGRLNKKKKNWRRCSNRGIEFSIFRRSSLWGFPSSFFPFFFWYRIISNAGHAPTLLFSYLNYNFIGRTFSIQIWKKKRRRFLSAPSVVECKFASSHSAHIRTSAHPQLKDNLNEVKKGRLTSRLTDMIIKGLLQISWLLATFV